MLARWIDERVPELRSFLRDSDIPELSRYAVLREAKTHVVGPMCHVLWRFTTGDAVGPNMMTRNAYALNMAYVLPNAPVPIERTMLEANMGGDKKPSYEYFQSGHGKTVIAETTLTDETIRRVLRTTAEDLEALAWAGTHGAVASGMQSVAFTPASAIAAIFTATGQDIGMVGTSSMAHGTCRRVEGGLHVAIRFPGLEVGTVGGGTTLPTPREWLAMMGCAGAGKATASHSWSRPPRSRSRSARQPRWRRPAPRTSSARTSSAAESARGGTATSPTSTPSDVASRTPWSTSLRRRVSRAHPVADPLALLGPPEHVLGEVRQHPVRRVDERPSSCGPARSSTRS